VLLNGEENGLKKYGIMDAVDTWIPIPPRDVEKDS
jgi:hypothetical protein